MRTTLGLLIFMKIDTVAGKELSEYNSKRVKEFFSEYYAGPNQRIRNRSGL